MKTTIPVSTVRQLARLVGSVSTPTGGYATCGNADGRCVNLRACTQRNGSFIRANCYSDLRVQVQKGWRS
jgi:hypothetical protein